MAAEIANAPNEGPRRADRRLCGRAATVTVRTP